MWSIPHENRKKDQFWNKLRVRKYTKFGVFYSRIVQMTPLRLLRESVRLRKFSVTNTLYVNCKGCKHNYVFEIKQLYTTKQEEGKQVNYNQSLLDDRQWIWAFQVGGPPQLLCVSLTIVYTCQDHVLESLKLDSKCSKMPPKFVKQKSNWLHSSIEFANPVNYSGILRA